eukprot:6485334-Amphidinium_carterae.2
MTVDEDRMWCSAGTATSGHESEVQQWATATANFLSGSNSKVQCAQSLSSVAVFSTSSASASPSRPCPCKSQRTVIMVADSSVHLLPMLRRSTFTKWRRRESMVLLVGWLCLSRTAWLCHCRTHNAWNAFFFAHGQMILIERKRGICPRPNVRPSIFQHAFDVHAFAVSRVALRGCKSKASSFVVAVADDVYVPQVELGLVPPLQPEPKLSSGLEALEARREGTERSKMNEILHVFQT